VPISVSIDVRDDDDGYFIEEINTTPHQFVADMQACGGIWLPPFKGMAPFIPVSEITSLFFDDGTYEPDEVDLDQHKDLTIN